MRETANKANSMQEGSRSSIHMNAVGKVSMYTTESCSLLG